MDSGPRKRGRRGFSLMELTLALLVMAAVLALAAPQLRGFASSQEVKNAAASIVALTRYARLMAASEGRPYRLNVDVDLGELWLTAQVETNFEELGVSFGRTFILPQGATIEWWESQDAESAEYVEIEPDGRSDTATLRLTGKLGTVLDVVCDAPSEPFRIEARPEEEYLYE